MLILYVIINEICIWVREWKRFDAFARVNLAQTLTSEVNLIDAIYDVMRE